MTSSESLRPLEILDEHLKEMKEEKCSRAEFLQLIEEYKRLAEIYRKIAFDLSIALLMSMEMKQADEKTQGLIDAEASRLFKGEDGGK